ncbi:MAG TPA: efflux RND transporter periplasmic adaptor subunit [Caulobacter sp.]|nr:efflux RND transporter periplasmic adaptor subunit [Caulobacter sp.]
MNLVAESRTPSASGADPAELLGEPVARPWWRSPRLLAAAGLVLVAVIVGVWFFGRMNAPKDAGYITEALKRGDLVIGVSATGTLQPVNTVSVGSELSGAIEAVLVDDNDRVRKGQILARLDTARLEDQIALNLAALASAEAAARQAAATLREAELTHDRNVRLAASSGGDFLAPATLDASQAALDRARASLGAARALITQAQANLRTSRTNLAKATIRSPIDGVVLARSVEPGQTVAASLQAPVLFTLAEDLTRMELQVDIDEADVGQVKAGQTATFSVDAFAGRVYRAGLTRVGLGSRTTEGVVTYTGVLSVDNSDESLRPGMTATAEIVADRRSGVLLVPAAALRFTPPAIESAAGRTGGIVSSLMPRMPGAGRGSRNGGGGAQRLWVLRDGQPVALPVTVGATDGQWTEVAGDGLNPGLRVITGMEEAA